MDHQQIVTLGGLASEKTATQWVLTKAGFHRLSEICPRTDTELLRLAMGADTSVSPEVVNLATAFFHERQGGHAPGERTCDGCDLEGAKKYAAFLIHLMG